MGLSGLGSEISIVLHRNPLAKTMYLVSVFAGRKIIMECQVLLELYNVLYNQPGPCKDNSPISGGKK